jgi:hypothetical protein
MNKPSSSPRRRERRSKAPELSQITAAIDTARTLRLALSAMVGHPLLADNARAAVTALQEAGAKLELIADSVAAAKTRKRRRAIGPETSTQEPSLGLEE